MNDQEEMALLRERLREATHGAAQLADQLADARREVERYQTRCRALELRLDAIALAMNPKYDPVRIGLSVARPEWWESLGRLLTGPAAYRSEPCLHLADSLTPDPNLNEEPCPICGRFYVDDA